MMAALEDIKDALPVSQAAVPGVYKIPKSTMCSLKQKQKDFPSTSSKGRPTVLDVTSMRG